jgi:hypothetical protein
VLLFLLDSTEEVLQVETELTLQLFQHQVQLELVLLRGALVETAAVAQADRGLLV